RLRVQAEDGRERRDRRYRIVAHLQAAAAGEILGLEIAEHLDPQCRLVPRRRVRARDGQRGEHPDLPVVDEQMRTGLPALRIAVEGLKVLDVLLVQPLGPLRQRRNRRVVEDDEAGPPGVPAQWVAVLIEVGWREALADDAFPSAHRDVSYG